MVGVDMKHLPEIKKCTDKVGEVTAKAAEELGLARAPLCTAVGGDASLIGVGAGAVGDWRRAHLQRHLRLGGHRCAGADG